MKDQQTHDYFNDYTPHYQPERFNFAVEFLRENSSADQCLIDIGRGDGGNLSWIKSETELNRFIGLDVSENYLKKVRELVGCETIVGSVLDDALMEEHRGKFDYCTLGSILHHLIGRTRSESTNLAQQCLRNSLNILKPGGHMFI